MIRLQALILTGVCGLTLCLAVGQRNQTAMMGFLTDTLCGAKGATERHIECAKRTVASGKARYAFYVEDPGGAGNDVEQKLYMVEPQEAAATWLGQRVKVTGTVSQTPLKRAGQSLDPATGKVRRHNSLINDSTPIAGVLHISSIEPAPALAPARKN